MKINRFTLTVLFIFIMYTSLPVNAQIITPPVHFTEEEIRQIQQNDIRMELYMQGKSLVKVGSQKYLPVKLVIQAYKNYCGPASAQMILNYKGIFAMSDQLILASNWGMKPNENGIDGNTIKIELNKLLGKTSYEVLRYNSSSFYNSVVYSLDKNYPTIYSLDISKLFYNPPYDTPSGHYVVGNGYYYYASGGAGNDNLTYMEPFDGWKYAGYGAGEYVIKTSDMVTAINANPNGANYIIRYVGN